MFTNRSADFSDNFTSQRPKELTHPLTPPPFASLEGVKRVDLDSQSEKAAHRVDEEILLPHRKNQVNHA